MYLWNIFSCRSDSTYFLLGKVFCCRSTRVVSSITVIPVTLINRHRESERERPTQKMTQELPSVLSLSRGQLIFVDMYHGNKQSITFAKSTYCATRCEARLSHLTHFELPIGVLQLSAVPCPQPSNVFLFAGRGRMSGKVELFSILAWETTVGNLMPCP